MMAFLKNQEDDAYRFYECLKCQFILKMNQMKFISISRYKTNNKNVLVNKAPLKVTVIKADVNTYNPQLSSSRQDYQNPQPHCQFEASLYYMRPCL